MRQKKHKLSSYYLPTTKERPADCVLNSHALMLQAGMIRQNSAGLYTFLPLAIHIIDKIIDVIREEIDKIGGSQVIMPTVQDASLWQQSGRYDSYGKEMLKIKDRHDRDLLYSPTNEEVCAFVFGKDASSYKHLPQNLYQINWKFRDEIRPRHGLMRAREFLMFDGYTFTENEEESRDIYFKYYQSFLNIFKKLGLLTIPVQAENGAIGGDLSHEFQIISDQGESEIVFDKHFEEIYKAKGNDIKVEDVNNLYAKTIEQETDINLRPNNAVVKMGIEVGHIFFFGDKYTKSLDISVRNKHDEPLNPLMGSYGIGVTRVLAAAIEANNDKNGIILTKEMSPFDFILVNLDTKGSIANDFCETVYCSTKMNVLYDDTDNSVGHKLGNADLIGIPYQVIIGRKTISNNCVQVKRRKDGASVDVNIDTFKSKISAMLDMEDFFS